MPSTPAVGDAAGPPDGHSVVNAGDRQPFLDRPLTPSHPQLAVGRLDGELGPPLDPPLDGDLLVDAGQVPFHRVHADECQGCGPLQAATMLVFVVGGRE